MRKPRSFQLERARFSQSVKELPKQGSFWYNGGRKYVCGGVKRWTNGEIKFKIKGEEYPAIVVVLKSAWHDKAASVLRGISAIDVPGMEYLLGVRFIDKFKTNPITAKRDVLSLPEETTDYYLADKDSDAIYRVDIGTGKTIVSDKDVTIITV